MVSWCRCDGPAAGAPKGLPFPGPHMRSGGGPVPDATRVGRQASRRGLMRRRNIERTSC
ncbi:protein of unknown function [Burkholderia multivorans]